MLDSASSINMEKLGLPTSLQEADTRTSHQVVVTSPNINMLISLVKDAKNITNNTTTQSYKDMSSRVTLKITPHNHHQGSLKLLLPKMSTSLFSQSSMSLNQSPLGLSVCLSNRHKPKETSQGSYPTYFNCKLAVSNCAPFKILPDNFSLAFHHPAQLLVPSKKRYHCMCFQIHRDLQIPGLRVYDLSVSATDCSPLLFIVLIQCARLTHKALGQFTSSAFGG